MPGIHREFAEHSLEVYPNAKPIKQTTRCLSEPKRLAVGAEIDRPLKANFIREIKISTWLANPVLVSKKNIDIHRMCIDYTTLNKHCPKDNFPLPRIDQIIDSTAGCQHLFFLDAYSCYQHIK